MDADHRSHGETVREPEGSGSEGWQEALRRIAEAKQAESDVLRLDGLGLSTVPPGIDELRHLSILDLDGNLLQTIPEILRELPWVQGVFLNRNQIQEVPIWFCELFNLRVVGLRSNRISRLPDFLAQMANLRSIEARGNPLPEELVAAAANGAAGLLRSLRSTTQEGVNPRMVKLVLLGEPKSGKTTLLEALKGNPVPCDPNREETVGVDVVTIAAANPFASEPIYLSVWDFAGQHMEQATHQFFLTEGAIYVVLWNARQGTQSGKRDVPYWLELLKMRVREPRFLLVATHTEHTPSDLNLRDIEEAYAGYQGHFPVDFETLTGFKALRNKIVQLAGESPSLEAKWPAGWLPIRDEIREIRRDRPHVTPAEFRKLIEQNGVSGDEASKLATQLHNVGEILYFQERDELSSLVILNPEWVTRLIARIVRSEEVRKHRGILLNADLNKLWKEEDCTPEVRRHLVNLMDWFDLTYSTGQAEEIGIVVEALPYSTPEALKSVSIPAGRPQIEMIFRFRLQKRLPPGIPTWAIARAHRFSMSTPWRDAAFFEDKETNSYAQILASDMTREVRLCVTSDFPPFFFGRMEAILRDTFKRYPGVAPEWRVPCRCKPDCSHSYRYETVRNRWRDRKEYVTCDESGEDVPIQSLLIGYQKPESEAGLVALRAEIRRQFTALLNAMREKVEKPCPFVFTLVPSKSFKQLSTWMESFTQGDELELTLYCEHDSGWHPTPHSLYRFRPDQGWFEELKRCWNRFVSLTKRVGPLANTAGKAAQIPWMEIGASGIENLPVVAVSDAAKFAAILGDQAHAGLADLQTRHVLCKLIEYLDVTRSDAERNGGLHKFLIDDGRWLWLCPDHVSSYRTRA